MSFSAPIKLSVVALLSLLGGSRFISAETHNNGSRNPLKSHPLLRSPKAFMSNVMGGGSNTVNPSLISGGATVLEDGEALTEAMEVSVPLSESATLGKNDAPLMRDINMLTDILLDIVQHDDPTVHDLFEEFLAYGRQRYVYFIRHSFMLQVRMERIHMFRYLSERLIQMIQNP